MISLERITKSYEKELYKEFSYAFPTEGIICLFAPSGYGKTTLFRLMLGLDKPESGRIMGMDNLRTSVVFQEDRLLPWLSGKENLLAVSKDEALCEKLIEEFGLQEDILKYPDQMSGGIRRQVSIMRALLYDGDVFFLDEPFQAIDVVKREEIITILKKRLRGKLTFFITHHLDEVYAFADCMLILQGTPLQVKETIHREDFRSIESLYEKINCYSPYCDL